MIISFGGDPGSGKTTIAKKLAKKLNWPYYDIGELRRQKAKELSLTLAQYNKLGEKDKSTDLEVDIYQQRLGQTKDNFIITGRTSWLFIPHSIKFFLSVDEKEGAKRVLTSLQNNNTRPNEDSDLRTIAAVLASHRRRQLSDTKRYKKYFNVNFLAKKNYDYVLNTTNLNKQQVFNKIYAYIKKISQVKIDKI